MFKRDLGTEGEQGDSRGTGEQWRNRGTVGEQGDSRGKGDSRGTGGQVIPFNKSYSVGINLYL